METFVTMYHADSQGRMDVPESLVEHWQAIGWTLTDDTDEVPEAPVKMLRDGGEALVPVESVDDWKADGWTTVTDVPDGTVEEVLAWVGDDPARAAAALEAEQDRDTPRVTLIDHLNPEA